MNFQVASNNTMKGFLTITLVLWLGGLSCALGCTQSAAAVGADEVTARINAAHACCHRAQGKSRDDATTGGSDRARSSSHDAACCLVTEQEGEQARGWHGDVQAGTALTASAILPVPDAANGFSPVRGEPYLPDRSGTYLRCCAFLI